MYFLRMGDFGTLGGSRLNLKLFVVSEVLSTGTIPKTTALPRAVYLREFMTWRNQFLLVKWLLDAIFVPKMNNSFGYSIWGMVAPPPPSIVSSLCAWNLTNSLVVLRGGAHAHLAFLDSQYTTLALTGKSAATSLCLGETRWSQELTCLPYHYKQKYRL